MSVHFSSILMWKLLSSLTFGFCSIWALHFVAMLACELDLPIGIDVPLTVLSSILAVLFTFAALAFDLLWGTYRQGNLQRNKSNKRTRIKKNCSNATGLGLWPSSSKLHPNVVQQEDGYKSNADEGSEQDGLLQEHSHETGQGSPSYANGVSDFCPTSLHPTDSGESARSLPALSPTVVAEEESGHSSELSESRRSSFGGSEHNSHGLSNIMNLTHWSTGPAKNAFVTTGEALYLGCTRKNAIKAFSWSLAVSGMHYVGITALRIPDGHYTLNPALVVLSEMISWVTCFVGVVLLTRIETHLAQQCLFSLVASTGVAAMHFTGMSMMFHKDQALMLWFRNGSHNVPVPCAAL